ncbi:MAG: hypothetical protein PHQ55_02860 [Eubacteriales bacterium]|jgi:hypothetical protein|nr:hypothetical protein [Eubacteriales bacterium]MDD3196777.1 hypothetical protein [Eubacteriales bacterium]MDD3502713.1 hypothetical protein [Eubacteriales bacterium]MDD4682094.1 hypothetical protein [Eubacteriales bacterium]
MTTHNIMIVKVNHRIHQAESLQKVLSQYGCSIKTRLGLHEAGDACANDGLIVLQLVEGQDDLDNFAKELDALEGIDAKLVRI